MGKLIRFPTHQELYDRVTAVENLANKNKEDIEELDLAIKDIEENCLGAIYSMEQNIQTITYRVEQLDERLNVQNDRLNNVDLVLINHEERLDNLYYDLHETIDKVNDLLELGFQSQMDALAERIERLETVTIEYGEILNTHNDRLNEQDTHLKQHDEHLENHDGDIDKLNKEMILVNKEFDSQITRINNHETRLTQHDDKFNTVDDKLVDHETRIDILEKYKLSNSEDIIIINNTLTDHGDRIKELEDKSITIDDIDLSEITDQIDVLKESSKDHEGRIEDLEDMLNNLDIEKHYLGEMRYHAVGETYLDEVDKGFIKLDGSRWIIDSPIGEAIKALPNDYIEKWNIIITDEYVELPDLTGETVVIGDDEDKLGNITEI